MPVLPEEITQVLNDALPITHLEIQDQSSGCGENYAILVVSEVCPISELMAARLMYHFNYRLSQANRHLRGIARV